MEENLSSPPEDLESDFEDETSKESEAGGCDGEGLGLLEVPSRLSFTRSCSQYSSSSEDMSSASSKVRRRKKRKRRGRGGSGSSQKLEVIEEAVRAGDKDRLSQLAVSQGGLLSDEVRGEGEIVKNILRVSYINYLYTKYILQIQRNYKICN